MGVGMREEKEVTVRKVLKLRKKRMMEKVEFNGKPTKEIKDQEGNEAGEKRKFPLNQNRSLLYTKIVVEIKEGILLENMEIVGTETNLQQVKMIFWIKEEILLEERE